MKIAEWASKKGFPPMKDFSQVVPVSQFHTQCFPSDGTRSKLKPPADSLRQQQPPISKPWTIFTGLYPEKPLFLPDLRDSIVMRESSSRQPEYVTKWDGTPHPLPDLPTDVLKRVLFPKAFPSRITSSRHFEPQGIATVQHRRYPGERTTSPWTEVAMHLAEVLEPGHYWSLPVLCGGLALLYYVKWLASRSDSRSHIHIKKGAFCHPTRSAQCDKNPQTLPDAVLWRGEKTSVNWVTCHRWIFALSMISLRDLYRDPGEVLSATGVGTVRWSSVLGVFGLLYLVKFFTPRRTSAHWPPGGSSRKGSKI